MSGKILLVIIIANLVAILGAFEKHFDATPSVIIFVGLAIVFAVNENK